MNYQIFQVKKGMTRDFGFMGLNERRKVLKTETIALSQIYDGVYSGDIEVRGSEEEALENLFETFNMSRPADFSGHSLSVGDIVKLAETYYYCDSFGWTDVTVSIA